jgi:histone-lysine N-methyltransferase SETMAR
VFFDIRGIVHRELVPQGQTVGRKLYCEVLWRLRENIRRKRPDLWRTKKWILHDDNAPCHRVLLVREFLANHNILSLPHPPCSPDLAPADFFLYRRWRCSWKVTVCTPLPRSSANRILPHTHVITKTPV